MKNHDSKGHGIYRVHSARRCKQMKKIKGLLFVRGEYQKNAKEGTVEILFRDNNSGRWTVMSGNLKKELGKNIFYPIDGFGKEFFEFEVEKVPRPTQEIPAGTCYFCLGGYSDGEEEYTTTSFPEMIAAYRNGCGELLIVGSGAENIEGARIQWYPMIFKNVESILPNGFYVNGEFWMISGKLVMRPN